MESTFRVITMAEIDAEHQTEILALIEVGDWGKLHSSREMEGERKRAYRKGWIKAIDTLLALHGAMSRPILRAAWDYAMTGGMYRWARVQGSTYDPPTFAPPRRTLLSAKARYQILERDEFTCRYCGAQPPEVVLVVDHILPVSKGGTNDSENLCAACVDCNAGKSDKA